MKESRGTHLDAHIVDTLLENLDVAIDINEQLSPKPGNQSDVHH